MRPVVYVLTSALTAAGLMCLAAATLATWMAAFCGEMYGSRPERGYSDGVRRDGRGRHVIERLDLP